MSLVLAVRPSRLAVRRLGTNASSAASQICLPVSVGYPTPWVPKLFRVILVNLLLSSFRSVWVLVSSVMWMTLYDPLHAAGAEP